MGSLTVVMETLPFGLCFSHRSNRAAARASRSRPLFHAATQRTAAKSGSRHFYKNSLAARWLEVASATLFRFQSTDWAARSAGCSVRLAQVGLSLFDHLAGDREQRRRHGEFGRLGGFQL